MKRSGGTAGRNAGCSCRNRRSPNVVGAQPHGGKEEERSSGPGFRDLIWEEDRSQPVEGGGGAAAAHAGWGRGTNVGVGVWTVHAFSVCDDPEYFYDYVQGLIDGLNSGLDSRDIVSIENAKGLGYAMNTAEELKFVKDIAASTGIVLDPVYSGKAVYGLLKDMAGNPAKWKGRKVLFIHTGGLLGLYDKADQLSSLAGSWRRMDLEDSVPRKDGTGKMF
ncbi:putative D-cysteine desulfhydrase 1, mitochondrial [Zea mays]|uniref:putative D-cysteine desulfhydrase 1, mitochondrial n=1 Tax=Zea mays TaxID=4577 RepID=UPI0004DEB4DD|nr:putative D-cysteine desulfhydrase 1, mitochondrial [Zea mays]|eukprot:XP_008671364.1 putative D-cysteine desulfhydrase 1, mitochondrial [Zea mays]